MQYSTYLFICSIEGHWSTFISRQLLQYMRVQHTYQLLLLILSVLSLYCCTIAHLVQMSVLSNLVIFELFPPLYTLTPATLLLLWVWPILSFNYKMQYNKCMVINDLSLSLSHTHPSPLESVGRVETVRSLTVWSPPLLYHMLPLRRWDRATSNHFSQPCTCFPCMYQFLNALKFMP